MQKAPELESARARPAASAVSEATSNGNLNFPESFES